MSDFTIKIGTQLDTSKIKTKLGEVENKPLKLTNISISKKSIGAVQSQLKNVFNKSYPVKIDTSSISKQISDAIQAGMNSIGKGYNPSPKGKPTGNGTNNPTPRQNPPTIPQDKVIQKFVNGDYTAKLSTMKSQINKYSGQDLSSLEKATELMKEYESTVSQISNHNNGTKLLNTDELDKAGTKLNSISKQFKNAMTIVGNDSARVFTQLEAVTASNKMLTWLNNNSKAAKKYGNEIRSLAAQIKQVSTVGEKNYINKQFQNIVSEANKKGLTGNSFFTEIGRGIKQMIYCHLFVC